MPVSQTQILDFVRQKPGHAMKMRELARALRVAEPDYPDFRHLVRRMAREGALVKLRNSRYGAPADHNLIAGRLSINPDGYGLLSREDGNADVFIGASGLGTALHGDRVLVRLTRGAVRGNRPEGEFARVLERAEQNIVGTFRAGDPATVASDDPRFPDDIAIPPDQTGSAKEGQKVVVRILCWDNPHTRPEGHIVEVLGDPDAPGMETLVLIKKHGLPLSFPDHIQQAAEAIPETIPEAEIARRLDLRNIPCITIDPFDARDHDDAVSLEDMPDGTSRLGIHIADVSHYVPEGSALDHEALARGTSVYLPDRVIPMLPERLSGDICSLRPGKDRLAISALFHIHPDGKVITSEIAETAICSRAHLTYDDVQKVIDDRPGARKTPAFAFADMLLKMERLRRQLTLRRKTRGTIDFDIPKPRIYLDQNGRPADIRPELRLDSHRLVEEFMLLANETIAQYATDRGAPILYRVHEPPDRQKLADFSLLAATFGYRLPKFDRLSPADIQYFLESQQNERIGHLLNTRLLRAMKKAVYTPKNLGHFGLACDTYTHFTSPIRRYPDLMVHRVVRDIISRDRDPEREARRNARLPDIGNLSTQREIAAQDAEWDAIRLMQVLYLEDKLGEQFTGTIADVRNLGFFVQLDDVLVEGLVHVNTLNDDYYVYRETQGALVGERTGKVFQIGDAVEVQLAKTDRQRLRIDFHLIGHRAQGRKSHVSNKAPKPGKTRRSNAKTGRRRNPKRR